MVALISCIGLSRLLTYKRTPSQAGQQLITHHRNKSPLDVAHGCGQGRGMSKEEFIALGQRIYGKSGWQRQLADDLAVTAGTVNRWANGHFPVPRQTQLAMLGLLSEKAA
jgi:hypothetical protein